MIKNNDALVTIIFVSLLFSAVCAIMFVRDSQTESYGPVVRVHSEYPVIWATSTLGMVNVVSRDRLDLFDLVTGRQPRTLHEL